MRRLSLFLATVLILAVIPLAAQKGGTRAAIESAGKQFLAALERGDAATMANLYANDAQVFPPAHDIISGREDIHKFWQSVIDSGVKSASLVTSDVQQAGHTAYEVGTYEMKGADGKLLDKGKYVVVWKRDNREWKLYRDIWNSSLPGAAR